VLERHPDESARDLATVRAADHSARAAANLALG
jgi:hypothetical protein